MDLGGAETVMQKIEELREWQRQQQQKLLLQQEEQRKLLSNEQQRIYQEFGLIDPSNGGNNAEYHLSSSSTPHEKSWLDYSSERDLDESQQSLTAYDIGLERSTNICKDLSMLSTPDCQRRLSTASEKIVESPFESALSKKNLNLDDTPVNTARKNFHELLQEKLTQLEGGDNINNYHGPPKNNNEKPKRKFLRKGEGIARFRMQPAQIKQTTKKMGNKTNVSTHRFVPNDNAKKGKIKNNNNIKNAKPLKENNACHKTKTSEMSKANYPKTAVSTLTLKKKESSTPPPATWAEVLQQQNLIHKVTHDQEHKTVSPDIRNANLNTFRKDSIELSFLEKMLEAEKISKKEVEELKIFELLEQHAANSSFCSTSSLVARLMEGSINSTPVKNHSIRNHTHQNDIHIPKTQHRCSGELVSATGQFSSNNPIVGYLPFGLDTEEYNGRDRSSDATTGAYQSVNDAVPKLALHSPCESSDVQSKKTDDGYSSLSERNLHVRFSETNDYKSVSDASFSSQDDSSKNTSKNSDAKCKTIVGMKRFQDDQAWSDDCSCSEIESPNNSSIASNLSQLLNSPSEPRSLPRLYDVYNNMTRPPTYPINLETRSNLITQNEIEKINKVDAGVNTPSSNSIEITEKSSLLKSRLEELEREIEIFRKENLRIQKLKKEHEDVVSKFNKEKKEFEKRMKEEKEKMESALQEDKKKLTREKQVFDRYCKDLKNQPSKHEREEVQSLKQQLTRLQEEMHKKDTRWTSTNLRTKDRMKMLQAENEKLKKEVEKLKNNKSQHLPVSSQFSNEAASMIEYLLQPNRSYEFSSLRGLSSDMGFPGKTKSRNLTSTKVIHAVNEHIAKIKPSDLEDSIVVHDVVPKKKIPSSVLQQQKVPAQAKAKARNTVLNKNEWGVMCSKTFQTIPDFEQNQKAEVTKIPEESASQSKVTNHKIKTTSNQGNYKNDIISLHAPSDRMSCTSAEEDDDLDCDDPANKSPENRNSDPHLNALVNTFCYTAQCQSISTHQTYATQAFKTDPIKVKGNKGGNTSSKIGEKKSATAQNCNVIGIKELYAAEIQNFIESSAGNIIESPSINSGIANITKSISLDAQISNTEHIAHNNIINLPPSSSGCRNSDIDFNTAKSPISNIETHKIPNDKNEDENIPTHDEIYILDKKRLSYSGDGNSFDSINTPRESSPSANRMNGNMTGSSQKSNHILKHTNEIGDISCTSGTLSKICNREKVFPDGRREIWYPNGNLKKISADGSEVKVIYYNGDVKETSKNGTVKYFYAETKTWHTTYLDGSEILEFPDGQMETRKKDGTKAVTYPNATVRTCFPDGREEWVFQDGLIVKVDTKLGEKVLLLPNGQREVHTREHMRREYPDGTVKILYPEGIQETRYSNGRIRVKDKDGKLIMDSIMQRL